ncbi:MAG: hypothetical protein FWC16_05415 [Defluviitaleaceae bacterium]|nr:hypothetical protein [Defluviitaleaceae bacterium]MCL2274347.1 hypothetical protein [Defluviitaleaceae bacterium]
MTPIIDLNYGQPKTTSCDDGFVGFAPTSETYSWYCPGGGGTPVIVDPPTRGPGPGPVEPPTYQP